MFSCYAIKSFVQQEKFNFVENSKFPNAKITKKAVAIELNCCFEGNFYLCGTVGKCKYFIDNFNLNFECFSKLEN